MAQSEEVRIAVALPQRLRDDLTDICFLLKVSEKDFVAKAISAALESVKKQKGAKLDQALTILRSVRADDE